MKFAVDRNLLEEKMKLVAKVIPKKSVVGSTNSVLFQIKNNVLYLWGTDGVKGLVTKFGQIDASSDTCEKVEVIFPVDKLLHIITHSTTKLVVFEQKKDKKMQWDVKTNSDCIFNTYPVEHFVRFQIKGNDLMKMNVDELNRRFRKVSATISEGDQSVQLTGIMIDGNYVTTDRQRMSLFQTNEKFDRTFIVPADLFEVMNSFSKQEVQVKQMEGQNGLIFIVGETAVQTRLFEGKAISYQHILDKLKSVDYKTVLIDKNSLNEAVERLKIFRDINSTICFDFQNDKLVIQVGVDTSGTEEIKLNSSSGLAVKLYLNVDAVVDFLNVLDGKVVFMKVFDERTPVLIQEEYTNGEKFYCMLSPMVRR